MIRRCISGDGWPSRGSAACSGHRGQSDGAGQIILEGMTTSRVPLGTLALRGPADQGGDSVRSHVYEITLAGQAGPVLRAEFDDCEVTVGPATTTLRAELPDPAALAGLMQRIAALRLEVVHVQLVAARPK